MFFPTLQSVLSYAKLQTADFLINKNKSFINMLKIKCPSKDNTELLLLYRAKNYKMKLFFLLFFGERDNQKLIKAPHCQHHMHSNELRNFLLTLSVAEKLKNIISEIPIISQTLNINNQRTKSAKSINLDIITKLSKTLWKAFFKKQQFLLSPSSRYCCSKVVRYYNTPIGVQGSNELIKECGGHKVSSIYFCFFFFAPLFSSRNRSTVHTYQISQCYRESLGFDIHLQVYQFFNFNSQYCLPLLLKRCLIRKFHQLSKAYSLDVVNFSHFSKYQKNIEESRNYKLNVAVSDPGINFIPVVTIHSTSIIQNPW